MYAAIKAFIFADITFLNGGFHRVDSITVAKLEAKLYTASGINPERICVRSSEHDNRLAWFSESADHPTCVKIDFFDYTAKTQFTNMFHFQDKEKLLELIKGFLFHSSVPYGCIERPISLYRIY